jgi:transposase
MLLNYKYRLYPTPDQADALMRSMLFARRQWNLQRGEHNGAKILPRAVHTSHYNGGCSSAPDI